MADFEIIPRYEWGARPPTSPLSPMTQPDGWVVHYVGGPMQQDPSLLQSKAAVHNLQEGAMNGSNGEVYIDIPYNFLVDLNGRIFEGRGWDFKNAANGSSNYNAHTWAVCVMMGPGDGDVGDKNRLTDEARLALAWLTKEGARRKAAVSYVKGHRDVYATHCPGDECYQFVPYLQAHLHDAPVDWAALARLADLQKRIIAKPLRAGEHRPAVKDVKKILHAKGYTRTDVTSDFYGSGMKLDVHQFKKDVKHPNTDGEVFGGPAFIALVQKK